MADRTNLFLVFVVAVVAVVGLVNLEGDVSGFAAKKLPKNTFKGVPALPHGQVSQCREGAPTGRKRCNTDFNPRQVLAEFSCTNNPNMKVWRFDRMCAEGESCVGQGECRRGGPLGFRCIYNDGCASNVCGYNNEGIRVCEEPNQPLGSLCSQDYECASNVCGWEGGGYNRDRDINTHVCVASRQAPGSSCLNHIDCASGVCSQERICA